MTYDGDSASVLKPYVIGKDVFERYGDGRAHRHIYSFPKLKLANRTTINEFKPNKKQSPAGGNQFNTFVEETITLTNIKKNIPYFMRFVENTGSGTVASFGGQIIQLNEFVRTSTN